MLNDIDCNWELKNFFKENPKELIVLSTIALAYNSLDAYPRNALKMANGQVVEAKNIEDQDPVLQECFMKTCEIRETLRQLENPYSPNWKTIMANLNNLSCASETNLSEAEVKKYNKISTLAHELANSIVIDETFTSIWNQRMNLN